MQIGTVTHYYSNLSVAIIMLENELKVGDTIKFEGNTTDFDQKVVGMQYKHKDIEVGKSGQEIGVKVDEKVREGDKVGLVE